MLKNFAKDPLAHFLLAGLFIFILYAVLNGGQNTRDDRVIVVDNERLAVWLQFRNKAFSPEAAARYLSALPQADRQHLIDKYVREEALYRHALSLGLDQNDGIIRQRLVQKMDYIVLGIANDQQVISEQDVRAYFQAHQDQYAIETSASFKHIFFKGDDAEQRARTAFADIQNGKPAPQGDRFLYRSQYAEAGYDLIKAELGMKIAETVLGENTPQKQWLRPLFSNYGWHLIWIAGRTEKRAPAFEEVAMTVLQDVQRERKDEARRTATDALVESYIVQVVE